jgi:hypothetical protein
MDGIGLVALSVLLLRLGLELDLRYRTVLVGGTLWSLFASLDALLVRVIGRASDSR